MTSKFNDPATGDDTQGIPAERLATAIRNMSDLFPETTTDEASALAGMREMAKAEGATLSSVVDYFVSAAPSAVALDLSAENVLAAKNGPRGEAALLKALHDLHGADPEFAKLFAGL